MSCSPVDQGHSALDGADRQSAGADSNPEQVKTLIAIFDLRAASAVSGIHPIVGVRNHQDVSDIDP
jgi:hypothetical protein